MNEKIKPGGSEGEKVVAASKRVVAGNSEDIQEAINSLE